MSLRARTLGLILSALAVGACGADVTGATSTTLAETTTTPDTAATTTTTTLAGTTTSLPVELPGEPIEIGPVEGDVVAVVGVAHDDVLNLRQVPGADEPIVAEIPPLEDSLLALGEARQLPSSIWIAVDHEGVEGWVNLRYIAYLAAPTDVTGAVLQDLGASPAEETIEGLGSVVIDTFTVEGSETELTMAGTMVTPEAGEIVYDLIGSEDDSVRGVRVHVEAIPYSGGFTLDRVETITLCSRGVTDEGTCI